jgi:hypothetical protein
MSAYGTKQTSCSPIWMSAFRGKAEIPASRVMSATHPEQTFHARGLPAAASRAYRSRIRPAYRLGPTTNFPPLLSGFGPGAVLQTAAIACEMAKTQSVLPVTSRFATGVATK